MSRGEELHTVRHGRCIIVGAGDFFGFPFHPEQDDFLIAADAGYEIMKSCAVRPDLIVGDFDSMQVEGICGSTGKVSDLDIFEDAEKAEYLHHLKDFSLDGIAAKAIDPIKNDPDLLACVRIGIEAGYREFHLLGATGQRVDHSIANQQILVFLSQQGMRGYLYDKNQVITAITNDTMRFNAGCKGYLSVFSFSDYAHGVTEKGLKYIITDVSLQNTLPTGLSNEFVGKEAEVSVKEGTLLLVYEYRIV